MTAAPTTAPADAPTLLSIPSSNTDDQADAIARGLEILHPPGRRLEILALKDGRPIYSGHASLFDDHAAAVHKCLTLERRRQPAALYVQLHEFGPDVATGAASNDNIVRRHWLLIDVDPAQHKLNATDVERAAAADVRDRVRDFLIGRGFAGLVEIDSGNGQCLLVPIDLPADAASARMVDDALVGLNKRYSTDTAKVDIDVGKASQHVRVPGTWNRRSEHTADRPHRLVRLIGGESPQPEVIEQNTALLRSLAAELGAEASRQRLAAQTAVRPVQHRTPGNHSSYGAAALEKECRAVASAASGCRNQQLNKSAYSLGQLVAGGELARAEAESGLLEAAADCGLLDEDGEAKCQSTIRSGLNAGEKHPRQAPARPESTWQPRTPAVPGVGRAVGHDGGFAGYSTSPGDAWEPPAASHQQPGAGSPSAPPAPATGAEIILDYFRQRYRPEFRRGNVIHCADGEEVAIQVACVPDFKVLALLESASDSPRYPTGQVKREALPGFFGKWAKAAWGELTRELPEEIDAKLGDGSAARETFRRQVKAAMLSEIVIGDVIAHAGVTQTERRSLIDWCAKWAKTGPWKSIRSKRCWTKLQELPDGEVELCVAIRVELFGQLGADKRLRDMTENKFAKLAERYGVGASSREARPHGQSAVALYPDFIRELTAGAPGDEADIPTKSVA